MKYEAYREIAAMKQQHEFPKPDPSYKETEAIDWAAEERADLRCELERMGVDDVYYGLCRVGDMAAQLLPRPRRILDVQRAVESVILTLREGTVAPNVLADDLAGIVALTLAFARENNVRIDFAVEDRLHEMFSLAFPEDAFDGA